MAINMLPFLLKPAFKDYIWGGNRLKTEYGKETGLAVVAESWELSAHIDGSCSIAGGELAGASFADFAREHSGLLGARCAGYKEFPILIKLIDARETLSVQVHPGDEYARRFEHEAGKNEMWIILDCDPGAFLYFGLNREITAKELRDHLEGGTVTQLMRRLPVKKGDVIFIKAGTLHAIGAGILLAEIQQNSNSTYRVYDFGRLGVDGKPRPLHIEKALAVASLRPSTPEAPGASKPVHSGGYTIHRLAKCPYFTVWRLSLNGAYEKALDDASFVSLLCVEGHAELNCGESVLPLTKGASAFVPCGDGRYSLTGTGEILITTI